MKCNDMWQVKGATYGAALEIHFKNVDPIETKHQVDPSGSCPCVFGGRRFFCLISQLLSKAAWQEQRGLPVSDIKLGKKKHVQRSSSQLSHSKISSAEA